MHAVKQVYNEAIPIIFILPLYDLFEAVKKNLPPHLYIHIRPIWVYSEQGLMGRTRDVPVLSYSRGITNEAFFRTRNLAKLKFDSVTDCKTWREFKIACKQVIFDRIKV